MKKITYIILISFCIIACLILLCLSVNNLNKKYDKYGYEISNWQIYKLNLAIENNNIEEVKKLIKHTNLNKRPLKPLTYVQRIDITEEKGLNPDVDYPDSDLDYYNYPPLSNACKNGNIPIIKLLIKNGADVNYLIDSKDYEYSPLYVTLSAYTKESQNEGKNLDKYISIIKLLIKNNVQLNMKSEKNPLLYIAKNHFKINNNTIYNDVDLFKIIISNSTEETPEKIKGDILHYLALHSNLDAIDYLINYENYDINTKDSAGENALFGAIFGKDEKVVKYLIDKGIDTKMKNKYNKTAYDVAVSIELDNQKILDLLK